MEYLKILMKLCISGLDQAMFLYVNLNCQVWGCFGYPLNGAQTQYCNQCNLTIYLIIII